MLDYQRWGTGDLIVFSQELMAVVFTNHTHSCLFETRRQTVASFIKELEDNFRAQRLTFGGFIAVMGGSVDIIGCTCQSRIDDLQRRHEPN